jgi:hypothetical protein
MTEWVVDLAPVHGFSFDIDKAADNKSRMQPGFQLCGAALPLSTTGS